MSQYKEVVIGKKSLKYPVVQGGMGIGVSLGTLAGNVAKEGGAGTISAAQIGFREPDFYTNAEAANLRAIEKEIQTARKIAPTGVIGINIMTVTKEYEEQVRKAAECGVDFIVSGAGLPVKLPEYVKDFDVAIIPVVSSLRSAQVLIKMWQKRYQRLPDAVVIEGPKAGGHLGFLPEQLEDISDEEFEAEECRIIQYVRELGDAKQVYIPVIVGGGVNTASDLKHHLELGADAIQAATKFVTTKECDAHPLYKEAYINCQKEDICIIKSPVGMPGRAIFNHFLDQVKKGLRPVQKCYRCMGACNPAKAPYCITEALIHAVKGELEEGLIFCGADAFQAAKITTVKQVMEELIQ